MSAIGDTLLATVRSVATVVVVFLTGVLLAHQRVLTKEAILVLSNLVNVLFVPCTLFVRLGGGLSVELLSHAWPLLAAGLLTLVFNFVAGALMLPLAKPKPDFRKWLVFGASFTNVIALPLIFVAALCSQANFRRPAVLPPILDDSPQSDANASDEQQYLTEDECIVLGEVYLFVYAMPMSFFIFVVAFNLLESYKVSSTSVSANDDDNENKATAEDGNQQGERSSGSAHGDISGLELVRDGEEPTKSEQELEEEETIDVKPSSSSQRWQEPLRRFLRTLLRPAVFSQIAGIIVGVSKPLQTFLFGSGQPLQPVTSAISILGSGLVAAGNLAVSGTLGIKVQELWSSRSLSSIDTGLSNRTLFFFVISRMLVLPGIEYGIIALIQNKLPDDQMLLILLYILTAMPTANLVIVIAQVLGHNDYAGVLSVGMLGQYVIGVFTMTMFVLIAYNLVDLQPK